MKIKEIYKELFLIFLILLNISFFEYVNPIYIYCGFIFYLFLKLDNKLYNPYFFLFGGSVYFLFLIGDYEPEFFFEINNFVSLILISFLSFSFVYSKFNNIEDKLRNFKKIHNRRLDFLFLLIILLIFFDKILGIYIESNNIYKGLSIIFNQQILVPSVFGYLIYNASENKKVAYIKSIFFLIYLSITNYFFNNDFSREYIFIYLILIFYINTVNNSDNPEKLNFDIFKRFPQMIIKFSYLLICIVLFSKDFIITGGDLAIVKHAIETINYVNLNNSYEIMMPFHNGILIYFPESFLPYLKPQNYNHSSWIIENIYLLNPEIFTVGMGGSLFSASYLYGGILGNIAVFAFIAGMLVYLQKFIDSYFFFGLYLFYLIKLPIGIFRLEETFIFSSSFILIIIMPAYYFAIRKFLYIK